MAASVWVGGERGRKGGGGKGVGVGEPSRGVQEGSADGSRGMIQEANATSVRRRVRQEVMTKRRERTTDGS